MQLPRTDLLAEQKNNKKKRYGLLHDIRINAASYLLALPAIIYVFIFAYCSYPFLLLAFEKFNFRTGIFNSPWIWFRNFEFFFKSNAAWHVMTNTLKLNVLFITCVTSVSIILALALNEMRSKSILRGNQAFMLFPNYLSWVVVSYMMWDIFQSSNNGFLNQILIAFNAKPVQWYNHKEYWTTILVIMRIWKDAGISAIIFLAAITGIDEELYESAMIDGAGRFSQMKAITLPLIAPTIAIITLLAVGRIMYGDFGMIYAIIKDRGPLYETTDVIDTYIFRAIRLSYGDPNQPIAIGVFQAVAGFIMVFGSNMLVRKYFKEGALY